MTNTLLFLGDIGGSELILIMVVILVFFGANKIPELARGLGKGIREFKDASSEIRSEFEKVGHTPPPSQQPAAYTSAPAHTDSLPVADQVQHHDTPLPGNPPVVGAPLDAPAGAPSYGTPDATRPRLDQPHSLGA